MSCRRRDGREIKSGDWPFNPLLGLVFGNLSFQQRECLLSNSGPLPGSLERTVLCCLYIHHTGKLTGNIKSQLTLEPFRGNLSYGSGTILYRHVRDSLAKCDGWHCPIGAAILAYLSPVSSSPNSFKILLLLVVLAVSRNSHSLCCSILPCLLTRDKRSSCYI